MRELICEFCSARQPYDPRPGAKCLNCGGPTKAPRRCHGCHAVVPPNPHCSRCKTPTVELELYPAAMMLAAKGTAPAKIAGRLSRLELGEREALEKDYRNSWLPVDDALETMYALIAERTGPQIVDLTRTQFEQFRKTMAPASLLPAIQAGVKTWREQKPVLSPWPHGISKAICDAAPLKLDRLRTHLDRPRGYDAEERGRIQETAGALAPSMGTAAFSTAYLNTLSYGHSLVLGELCGSHETQPVFDLHEAARGQEPVDMAIPVTLVRDRGIVWAFGARPSHDVAVPWVPEGYVYAPFAGAPIPMHDLDGLRAFLKAVPIAIEPATISQLVHWLLAPFPWNTSVAFEEDTLLDAWYDIEVETLNDLLTHQEAGKKLGVRKKARTATRDELVLHLKPSGTTLVYRPAELEVRGPAPSSRVTLPAFRAPAAPLPEDAPADREMACGNCGVRRAWVPGTEKNCANCGAAPDAGTTCFSCFEAIPPKLRCTHCGAPTLPLRFHALALMLRSKGVEIGGIPARARAITPPEQADLAAWYRTTWQPVDDAIEGLRTTLKRHFEPELLEGMIGTVKSRRWNPGCTREETIEYVGQLAAMASAPAAVAPFSHAVCKAVHEAAPVRLQFLDGTRGLDDGERGAVAGVGRYHGKDADFAIGAEYLNQLSYRHLFVWGEVPDRNETRPLFELAEAAKRSAGIPVLLVRKRGVIFAQGATPTAEVTTRWNPTGFVFVSPEKVLPLNEIDGLRAFLKEMKAPISPETLPFLVHVLLAPFPWAERFEEPTGLIGTWKDGVKPSVLKRLFGAGGANELVLKVGGKRVTYRPGEVEIE